jgi:hypothetical protein
MMDSTIELYIDAVIGQSIQPDSRREVRDALRLIENLRGHVDGQALRLLALRRYLRIQDLQGKHLHAGWAWTPEQTKRLSNTGSAKVLMDEAAKVQHKFAAQNPGYTLAISPIRSLLRQVQTWSTNPTGQAAAKRLIKAMLHELEKPSYALPITPRDVAKFAQQLRETSVHPEPSSAAPGTSDHGQLRAVDFVVLHAGRIIAGTDTRQIAAVWKQGGWESKRRCGADGALLRTRCHFINDGSLACCSFFPALHARAEHLRGP